MAFRGVPGSKGSCPISIQVSQSCYCYSVTATGIIEGEKQTNKQTNRKLGQFYRITGLKLSGSERGILQASAMYWIDVR